MKSWICANLLGEHSDSIGYFGMVAGMGILGFLFASWAYLFVYIPFFVS
jgi:hypothetical protein